MNHVKMTMNDQKIQVPEGTTILEAARTAGIYIPTLCYHPDLPPAKGSQAAKTIYQGEERIENASPEEEGKGCGLCLVEVEGEDDLVGSCASEVREGMVVVTENDRITVKREENLIPILTHHPHACLTCAQQEGCSRTQCSTNVPENERCCPRFGHCELQNVANYVGISDATPKWIPTDFAAGKENPLYEMEYNLCIGCTRCVRACRDLRGIEALGFVYDEESQARVGSLAPALEDSGCKFCTACVEVCPTGALIDKAAPPGKKEEDLVPCKEACPAHIDIPGYLRLIAEGKADEANAVIREEVPFPGILGRVCIHPCEEVCRRGEVNEPIAICILKRYAADREKGLWKEQAGINSGPGKKVAIVGAGPAGLTAAFYLRKQGHGVTIFESRSKAGGMMRYGIPAYRLPGNLLDREIQEILETGIEFRPNQILGKNSHLDQLKKEGFDAVFLAVGAQLSRRITIEGSDLPDVLWGVDFLGTIAQGDDIQLKEKVIVIGGGSVAVDVALSALRCGAKGVTIACLEIREEMPAHEWEIEGALEEGVQLMPSWGPHRILSENGQVTGVELVRCSSVFDDQGNFCPAFNDSKETLEGDQVIMAIGQASDLLFLGDNSPISADKGLIRVEQESLKTGMKDVYAGGDVASMPGAIIHAVAAGRKAASSIDKALGGKGDIEEVLLQREAPGPFLGRDEGFASWPREKVPQLAVESRHQGFQEVVLGYESEEQAVREAKRCLQCDLRLQIGCNPSPPEKWLAFNEESLNQVPEREGVFQLLDEEHSVLAIKGTANLREDLLEQLEENEKAAWFEFEEDKMYSKRESELIQQYLQEYGEMPGGGNSDLDDLF
ncbi:MAG: FAD-dependent oxidoreductase [Desulfatiglandales bacterium]|jgi:NADPH-dependent glutamate synthase beta subunit-like oxidoreductase/formate hydrogenlyase subunit 6/NADH:ubiquinone oxidoreductase subunit I|nr:FAD-dependent oxidoreductase [Desulfatiglandales bacterium]